KKTVEFGKGRKRYYISFGNYEPKTAREKALFMSVYYALVYYSVKHIDRILLTDLMENIGYPKLNNRYGFMEYQKEEVIEIVWNVAKSEIGVSGSSVPSSIKKLFPEVEKKDIFKMNIFSVNMVKQYSASGHLKNAVILFKPNFDRNLIRFNRTSEALGLPISEPEYKNIAIYVVYGRNLSDTHIKKTVRELLEIGKIDICRKNPERTYNKLLFVLEQLRTDKYIEKFDFNPYPYGKRDEEDIEKGMTRRSEKNWFDKFLDSEVTLIFSENKKAKR
ncbi:hypothetical protein H5T89_12665, partial [bacterium]|nr:hypothetical protein [bacterium]